MFDKMNVDEYLPTTVDKQSLTALLASAGLGALLGAAAYKILTKQNEEVNEVLFFPDSSVKKFNNKFFEGRSLKAAPNKDLNCSSSLVKFTSYVRSAKVSLDLCLMLITCHEFGREILELKRRGVKVRVIVDQSNMNNPGCQIDRLRAAGISIVEKCQTYLMHHKFAIIDSRMVLNGSFNWTGSAVYGNNENVVVSTNKKIVAAFNGEFDKLWRSDSCQAEQLLEPVLKSSLVGDYLLSFLFTRKETEETEVDKQEILRCLL